MKMQVLGDAADVRAADRGARREWRHAARARAYALVANAARRRHAREAALNAAPNPPAAERARRSRAAGGVRCGAAAPPTGRGAERRGAGPG